MSHQLGLDFDVVVQQCEDDSAEYALLVTSGCYWVRDPDRFVDVVDIEDPRLT